jgi:hypothetical protein
MGMQAILFYFVCCMSANSPPAIGLRTVSFSPMEALAFLDWEL